MPDDKEKVIHIPEEDLDQAVEKRHANETAKYIELVTREVDASLSNKQDHEFTLQEYVATKTGTLDVMPKTVVERYLTEVLTQIKLALDVVWYEGLSKNYKSIKPVESVKGLFVIAGKECASASELLGPYHDASLNKKHRGCRKVINIYLDRIEEHREKLLKAKNTNNKEIKEFVKETIEFITAFHIVLSEETSGKERGQTLRNYCE